MGPSDLRLTERADSRLAEVVRWQAQQPAEIATWAVLARAGTDAPWALVQLRATTEDAPDRAHFPTARIVEAVTAAVGELSPADVGVLLIHNHPHDRLVMAPSERDLRATMAIRDAVEAAGGRLIDHLICGPKAFAWSWAKLAATGDGRV